MIDYAGLSDTIYARLVDEIGVHVTGILESTREDIEREVKQGIDEGLGAAELGDRIEEATAFNELRAETIARTETATLLNRAATESYREFGITHVTVIDGDDDPECAEANGQVWTLDEAAENPIQHPNCVRDFAPFLGEVQAREAEPTPEPSAALPDIQDLEPQEAIDTLNAHFGLDVQFDPTTERGAGFSRSDIDAAAGRGTIKFNPELEQGYLDRLNAQRDLYRENNAHLNLPGEAGDRELVAQDHGIIGTLAHEYGHAVHSNVLGQGDEARQLVGRITADPPSGRALEPYTWDPGGEAVAEAFAAVAMGEPDRWGFLELLGTKQ